MIITPAKIAMKDYLRTLKISGHHIFSEDTMEYLTSPED